MNSQKLQRLGEQRLARFGPMPGRGTGRMRQWNRIQIVTKQAHAMQLADDVLHLFHCQHLRNGQLADGQDQLRTQQVDFRAQPVATLGDLALVGHPIPPFWILARKAPTHSGHVYPTAKVFLWQPDRGEPLEHGLARSPRKRSGKFALARARRLAEQHDAGSHRPAAHHRSDHLGAAITFQQGVDV